MEIKRASVADSAEIAAMELACFADAWSESDVRACICSELSMCYAAIRDGELVGYLLGKRIVPEGEIYRIAVKAEKRQMGIGSRLLMYALRQEIEMGVESIFLEVREQNAAARGLYLSAGFVEIGIRKNYYQNPTDNAIIIHRNNNDFKRLSAEMFHWTQDNPVYTGTNVVEIAKDRDNGTQDVFIPLWYEPESKRLKNAASENINFGWVRDEDMIPDEWRNDET